MIRALATSILLSLMWGCGQQNPPSIDCSTSSQSCLNSIQEVVSTLDGAEFSAFLDAYNRIIGHQSEQLIAKMLEGELEGGRTTEEGFMELMKPLDGKTAQEVIEAAESFPETELYQETKKSEEWTKDRFLESIKERIQRVEGMQQQ